MAAKDELDYTPQWVHRPCSRLRSQVPFASSQFSRLQTLLRAKALAQAAPWWRKAAFQNRCPLPRIESRNGMRLHPDFGKASIRYARLRTLLSTCEERKTGQ